MSFSTCWHYYQTYLMEILTDVLMIFFKNKIVDSLFFLSLTLWSITLSFSCPSLNLNLKVSEEPHGVHHKTESTAGELSSQHSGKLYSRKQVLLIHTLPQKQNKTKQNTRVDLLILENDYFLFLGEKIHVLRYSAQSIEWPTRRSVTLPYIISMYCNLKAF